MGFCEDIMTGPVVCTYFAVVLILLVIVFMHVLKMGWYVKEHYRSLDVESGASWQYGNPTPTEAPVGGSSLHVAGRQGSPVGKSVLTDTGQEPYGTGYNARTDPAPIDM